MLTIDTIMRTAPVIPVIVIDRLENAVPMAEALVAGGLPILEVTLRTPVALEAIAMMTQVPGAIVGAGTVLNGRQSDQARKAGARFVVSPGLSRDLANETLASAFPYLPGIASASDIMRGLDLGLDRFKFFPAEAIGGLKALRAYASVFAEVRFCPTGGISPDNAPEWLAEKAVLCVGGSWLTPANGCDVAAMRASAILAAACGLNAKTLSP